MYLYVSDENMLHYFVSDDHYERCIFLHSYFNCGTLDLEGKADMKIRAMEILEELRTQRADKQVHVLF